MAINANFAALCPDVDAGYIEDVLAPIGTELTNAQLEMRINQAYFYTKELIGNLGDCGGSDAYCEIAALVAAHMVTISERQTKRESVAQEWTVEYMGKDGLGLDASLYGQQAVSMDCSGILAEKKAGVKRATFSVMGRDDFDGLTSDYDVTGDG